MRFTVTAALCIAILIGDPREGAAQPPRFGARGAVDPDEIAYRALLNRYLAGDASGAVNEALDTIPKRHGGFTNFLCVP